MRPSYLLLESPSRKAVVDFISAGFVVTITTHDGRVDINVVCPHSEGSSSWDEHDFEITLPSEDAD